MKALIASAAFVTATSLAACGPTQTPAPDSERSLPASVGDGAVPARSGGPADTRTAAPAPLTPEAERDETGARDLLLDFARGIERRRFGEAWALLSPADKRKWTDAQFAALFSDLREMSVAVPAGTIEGTAGSLYYTSPVTVTGSDADGRPVRLDGEAVLRRVNGVDGATATQRHWHFQSLRLDWTH